MLRSDLCDYSDAHIVVKGNITVTDPDNAKRNKLVAFENKGAFTYYAIKKGGEGLLKMLMLDYGGGGRDNWV